MTAPLRNAALAVLATGLLLGALVFLFPTSAEEARLDMVPADVASPLAAPGEPFDLTFTVFLPEGVHLPTSHVRALVAGPEGPVCDTPATLLAITGAPAVVAPYHGLGLEGTGPGHGAGVPGPKHLQVHAQVQDCPLPYEDGRAALDIQAFLGNEEAMLAGRPVQVVLFDPAAVSTDDPTSEVQVTATTSHSGLTSTGFLLETPDHDSVASGTQLELHGEDFTLRATTLDVLPEGTRITLDADTAEAATELRLRMHVPGQGAVDAHAHLRAELDLKVPHAFFEEAGRAPADLRVHGDEGEVPHTAVFEADRHVFTFPFAGPTVARLQDGPRGPDADHDGVPDEVELALGSDPWSPYDRPEDARRSGEVQALHEADSGQDGTQEAAPEPFFFWPLGLGAVLVGMVAFVLRRR